MSQTDLKNKPTSSLPIIGILGAGQLSTMMTQAYQTLGGQTYVFDDNPNSPASRVANEFVEGSTANLDDLVAFFHKVDIVTLENEFIDSALLIEAAEKAQTKVYPDPKRYSLVEDKLSENRFFDGLGIAIAEFFEVKTADDLIEQPGYLKLRAIIQV